MCDIHIHIIKSRSVLTGSLVPDRDFSDIWLKLDWPDPIWPWSRTDIDRQLFGTDRCGNRGIDRILPNPDRPDRGTDKCRSVPGRIPVLTRPEAITDPKLLPPSEFSSKISEFRNFMAQCTLTFMICPNTYDNDEKKVLFVISLLCGSALSWAHEIAENENHALCKDYTTFKISISNIYLD